MRIYIAGFGNGKLVDQYPRGELHILESYFYMNKTIESLIRREKTKIFMDSGAFSARTLGVKIEIKDYGDYLKANEDLYELASVLDAPIGDCEGSYRAQKTLEDMGCSNVYPVIHAGEPMKWAERYIKEGYTYLLIGGLVRFGRNNTMKYLDELFEKVLCDSKGRPLIKTHGFGLTTFGLVHRYPWTSVDSTRWLMGGQAGTLFLPNGNDIRIVNISFNSPRTKVLDQHYDTLPEPLQQAIAHKVAEMGFGVDGLRNHYKERNRFNIEVFAELQNILHTDTFKRQEIGLYD